jgi:hypothetical protein
MANSSGGYSEGINDVYNGYSIQQTGTNTLYCSKMDKSVYAWSVVNSSISGQGSCAAAIQGNSAGYFCGGANVSTAPSITSTAVSSVFKLVFAPEAIAAHSASLSTARSLAAGFEG